MYRIFSGKWRRYFSWKNFSDIFLIGIGFFQSLFLLIRLRPDVIFSKGGFSAVPAATAAFFLRIPLVVHESDAVPGVANRYVQRFAKKVLTSFPVHFGECVGTPIRKEIFEGDKEKGKKMLSFSDFSKPILFGFGGSQGAEDMNKNIVQVLDDLLPVANIVWVSGPEKSEVFPEKEGFKVFEYLHDDFPHVLAASDIVVSRAGSSSLFEVAALEKPMILIPLATAAGNHQEKNAKLFSDAKAALVLYEKNLTPENLKEEILGLIQNPEEQKTMSAAAKRLVKRDAAEKIAEEIRATIHKK